MAGLLWTGRGPRMIYVRRLGRTLVPADSTAEDAIAELPSHGEIFGITHQYSRSRRQDRLYRGLCHKIALMLQAMGREQETGDMVSDRFKMIAGHYELVPLPPPLRDITGERYAVIVRSTRKLNQAAFNAFMDRVTAFTITDLLPHFPDCDLRHEVEAMLRSEPPE